MKATPTALPGVLLIEPRVFGDDRGFFFESFNQTRFSELTGHETVFVQDNHSRSVANVIRGLHYQLNYPQGKLVRVIAGEVFDVAVDLRRSSATYGKWAGATLSAANRLQLWIPPGFAHGFSVLSESAEFLYKTTEFWHPEDEFCIRYDDPTLAIDWHVAGAAVVSGKDLLGQAFAAAKVFD
jgi:dTDP-4-dehydrorhamnose 3,5-epimerase